MELTVANVEGQPHIATSRPGYKHPRFFSLSFIKLNSNSNSNSNSNPQINYTTTSRVSSNSIIAMAPQYKVGETVRYKPVGGEHHRLSLR